MRLSTLGKVLVGFASVSLMLGSAGCSPAESNKPAESPSAASQETASGEEAQWPRTIEHANGSTVIPTEPQRIVSTSVVLSGSLLALDAPLIASAATKPGGSNVDERGFFAHWSDKATEKGVEVLYANSELDIEAVSAANPDLIIISASGHDSTADAYDELSKIAPVVSINYNSESWQDVLNEVSKAVGKETQAKELLENYDELLSTTAKKIQAPDDPVQMVVYSARSEGLAFALPNGPHDQILQKLGIKLDETDLSEADEGRGGKRSDFAFLSAEASIAALNAKDILFVGCNKDDVESFMATPGYSELPVVQSANLVPLGQPSFKLDYFSAVDMVKHIADAYGK